MAKKKKFYSVAAGRKTGIFTTWGEAEAQVKGYPGAKYKSFPSREEAENWLREPVYDSEKRKPAVNKGTPKYTGHPDNAIIIHTDGGAINNPGPGGYGVVIENGDDYRELSGGFKMTTNNRMELMACIVALETVGQTTQTVILYSDSSYVVNGISKGWATGWRKKGWKKADGKPAINPDLWSRLLDCIDNLDITFRWVKGHAGHPLNERCDRLAVAAAKGRDLPIDDGYEKVDCSIAIQLSLRAKRSR